MGITLLSITLAIELVIAIYSLVSKSQQLKTRAVLHLIEFAIFLWFLLAAVIEWNFRWYGLGALLLIWSTLGVYRLFSKNENEAYQVQHIVRRLISASLLALLAVSPALIFPPSEPLPPTGPYAVTTARYTYTDANRIDQFSSSGENRKVNVVFWYPQNPGGNEKYPLVVFSHGGLGTENSNESLYLELASHGYVVCSIGHPYHAFWTKDEDGHITLVNREYFGEILREDARFRE